MINSNIYLSLQVFRIASMQFTAKYGGGQSRLDFEFRNVNEADNYRGRGIRHYKHIGEMKSNVWKETLKDDLYFKNISEKED